MRVTFIGGGNMAIALASGLVARGNAASELRVVEPSATQRDLLAERLPGIAVHDAASRDAVADSDVVVLAVKPQQMHEASAALAPFVAPIPVVLTIAAGVRCGDIARWLGGYRRLVRAMPNTPALVGQGISGVYAMPETGERARDALRVLESCGGVIAFDREEALDAVNAVSGNGPGYVFYFLEALEDAALELGLPADVARRLAFATFEGSVALARQSGETPATLRAKVTSKGGTTQAAIGVLDRAAVRRIFVDAVKAGAKRARELGDEFGREG
ncbi:MAG TPA: pyrroline-5-carboxylate reductase [Casimicrobiaceae bacterium]|nr:pyrroline-5-carboxylate reductase [Casimicrobiaceae bacterium]